MLRRMMMLGLLAALLLPAAPSIAKDPYKAPNNSWISLNGKVVSTTPTSFQLDYGTGLITVDMDGWAWYSKSHPFLEGDDVIVYGKVDDNLYTTASIEARSVYVDDLNTYFYANDTDEESVVFYTDSVYVNDSIQVQGTIVETSGREFTLDTGSQRIKVDTLEMPYNPLDDKGYQKLKKGDFVQVSGELDVDFFEKSEIMAKKVTTLFKDTSKKLKS